MIRTSIVMESGEIKDHVPLSSIKEKDVKWYWVDFSEPSSKDIRLLKLYFRFHPLAVEDCLDDFSQRPKLDFYDQYIFVLLHGINPKKLDAHEVNMFVNGSFIVTFHKQPVKEVDNLWEKDGARGRAIESI